MPKKQSSVLSKICDAISFRLDHLTEAWHEKDVRYAPSKSEISRKLAYSETVQIRVSVLRLVPTLCVSDMASPDVTKTDTGQCLRIAVHDGAHVCRVLVLIHGVDDPKLRPVQLYRERVPWRNIPRHKELWLILSVGPSFHSDMIPLQFDKNIEM